ncbi:uncharacterized protein [Amphiura filiformis]|uniref:uncharacterized protein n=1 Tax=Amphiura filiformis TaxID=82378 RepID=UPI003B21A10A
MEADQEEKKRRFEKCRDQFVKEVTATELLPHLYCLEASVKKQVKQESPQAAAQKLFDELVKCEYWYEDLTKALYKTGYESLADEISGKTHDEAVTSTSDNSQQKMEETKVEEKERLFQKCKERFVKEITPSELLPLLDCLEPSVKKLVNTLEDNVGHQAAAQKLSDELVKHDNWYEDLTKALYKTNKSLADEISGKTCDEGSREEKLDFSKIFLKNMDDGAKKGPDMGKIQDVELKFNPNEY